MYNIYFKRDEFSCKCGCGFNCVDTELLNVLVDIRTHFNQPVTITSGNRCIEYNIKIGSTAKQSKHTKGIAVDIVVKNIKPQLIYDFVDKMYPATYGLGNSKYFTHIDVRENKARWTY